MLVDSYLDFDILVGISDHRDAYWARVVESPAGETSPVPFSVPFSPAELRRLVIELGPRGRRAAAVSKEVGARLFDTLFQGELRESLLRSLTEIEVRLVGLRIRLRLGDVPELAGLPWELLYDRRSARFLCLSNNTPLVRYLEVPRPQRPLVVRPPLRVLVMIANPAGRYAALEVEQEWDKLREAVDALATTGQVVLERLEAGTLLSLQRRLRRGDWHVFHFIGHGGFDSKCADGVLVCEDAAGHAAEVSGEQLGRLLSNHRPMRLVVLNSCEGARGDGADPFAGTAQSLVRQGLPAVVAMQFEITDTAAIVFARELYGAVAEGLPLEAAMAEGRLALSHQVSTVEWATPVLYSRTPDGRIFDIAAVASALQKGGHRRRPARPEPEAASTQSDAKVVVRHGRSVTAVALSPNGCWLASGSNDGDARIWDVESGNDHLRFRHGEPVTSLAFSPDSCWLATGCQDGSGRIWGVASLDELCRVTHRSAVRSVAFSPDGRWLATGGDDGDARIWDAASGRERVCIGRSRDSLFGAVFRAEMGPVLGVAFSPDGRWLATACGPTAYVWDSVTARKRATLRHGSTVRGIAFSPDGHSLATTGGTAVRFWDPVDGAEQGGVTSTVALNAVAFSADGRQFAAAGDDGSAHVWEAGSSKEPRRFYQRSRHRLTALALSLDGQWLATGGSDCSARIWSMQDSQLAEQHSKMVGGQQDGN